MVALVAEDRLGLLSNVQAVPFTTSIVPLAGGGFVTIGTGTNNALTASVYDDAGRKVGADIQITAASSGGEIVSLPGGGFAVAWSDGFNTGGSPTSDSVSVKAQIFDSTGTAVAPPTTLATNLYAAAYPNIALNPNGTLIASWSQYTFPVNPSLVVRTIDGGGTPLGPAVTFDPGQYYYSNDIAVFGPDRVAIAATSYGGNGIAVRVFDPTSNAFDATPLIQLVPTGESFFNVKLARLASGNLVLGWAETNNHINTAHTQVYTPQGVTVGPATTVTLDKQADYSIATRDNGGYAIAYQGNTTVNAQLFSATSTAEGSAFGAGLLPFADRVQITSFGTDDLAVSYTSNTTDANGIVTTLGAVALFYSTTSGTTAADALDGTAGRDILRGLAGADVINGFAGDDALIGGDGADMLNGGDGNDTADYSDSPSAVAVSLATGVASGGTAEGDTLISIERLTGSSLNDVLTGDAGANRLDGGDGDDLLVGGAGTDTLIGGGGVDTADYGVSSAGVIINLLAGTGQGGDAEGDTLSGIERVTGSVFADTLIGNASANTLTGGAGDDILIGGINADVLDGGSGNDTASYETSGARVVVTLGGTAQLGDAQGDTLISIENLRGSAYDDALTGDGGANRLEGLGGNDTLAGRLGADVLSGGAGNDLFSDTIAGLNGDTITDFAIGDTILFQGATRASLAVALNGQTLTFAGGSLTLAGFNLPTGYSLAVNDAQGGVAVTLAAVPVTPVHRAAHDFNGDGRADILWRNANGALTDWLANSSSGFAGNAAANASVGTDWKIVGTGDFNGDGRSDVLWRNDNGALTDWLANANGGFAGNATANGSVGTDWKIVGTGDFNGDGRSDILWRNANGALTDWLANASGGFTGNAAANGSVGTDWKIVGTGDFNGDGRSDILWRNDNGQLTDWLGNAGGGFAGNAAGNGSVGTDWKIVGTGDFNGDGRSDILWRNDNGQLTDWLANTSGGFAGNARANATVGTDWTIVGTGDYNGDGFDDILWRNANGQLTNWLSDANGVFHGNAAANAAVGTDWLIVM